MTSVRLKFHLYTLTGVKRPLKEMRKMVSERKWSLNPGRAFEPRKFVIRILSNRIRIKDSSISLYEN